MAALPNLRTARTKNQSQPKKPIAPVASKVPSHWSSKMFVSMPPSVQVDDLRSVSLAEQRPCLPARQRRPQIRQSATATRVRARVLFRDEPSGRQERLLDGSERAREHEVDCDQGRNDQRPQAAGLLWAEPQEDDRHDDEHQNARARDGRSSWRCPGRGRSRSNGAGRTGVRGRPRTGVSITSAPLRAIGCCADPKTRSFAVPSLW